MKCIIAIESNKKIGVTPNYLPELFINQEDMLICGNKVIPLHGIADALLFERSI